MVKKLVVSVWSILLIFSYFHAAIWAKVNADSLILQDDGAIVFVIDSPVLGVTTDKKNPPADQKPPEKKPEAKQKSEPAKFVPVVSSNQHATVTVNPKNDKQVTITVTETPKNPTVGSSNPIPLTKPTVVSTKNVDKVVLEGKNNSVIMSVAPVSQKTLMIENQGVQAQTALPLQIDSITHAVSAQSSREEKVNILLPKVVLQNLATEGLVGPLTANQTITSLPQMSLNLQGNDVVYTVMQERKLFNTLPLPPSVITVSNATGKSLVPLYSRLFGLIFFKRIPE